MPSDLTTAEKAEKLGLQQCASRNCGCNGTTWKDHANDRRYHVSKIAALYAERFPAPDYRATLTPADEGELEARKWADTDADEIARDEVWRLHGHLRTALALLDAERAKAADAARERAAIVADLREAATRVDSTPPTDGFTALVNVAVSRALSTAADRYESGAHNKVTP